MANVMIVAYLLIVLALIAVILLQRPEGGALGIGGSGGGGLMTARGSANLLTRTTAILAMLFFATAIGLTILSELDRSTSGILDRAATTTDGSAEPASVLDALNSLQGDALDAPPAVDATPAADAAPAESASQSNADLPAPDAPATIPATSGEQLTTARHDD
ncbi:MAG: preprotein translocase subunit SecG [Candidatus Devosia symbiotica]|nr:preprotein translocase subunit SecG [Candidatus Devosia symbiotica]